MVLALCASVKVTADDPYKHSWDKNGILVVQLSF